MKMMKTTFVAVTAMLVSMTAFAGKEEREYHDKTLMPAVKDAMAKVKASCGCAMNIVVDDSVKTSDAMYGVKHIADFVAEGAPTYCNDAPSKKAVCQMKTLKLAFATDATFSFKGGTGVATSNGSASCSFEMMTRELDK
jgi:hypothetical protein